MHVLCFVQELCYSLNSICTCDGHNKEFCRDSAAVLFADTITFGTDHIGLFREQCGHSLKQSLIGFPAASSQHQPCSIASSFWRTQITNLMSLQTTRNSEHIWSYYPQQNGRRYLVKFLSDNKI
jgi:hypothetical protein